jgi:hypothetical protein
VSTATLTTASATRPEKSEFLPYYERYIALVPEGDVVANLVTQMNETQELLRSLPASVATYRYAPDKWSVNEVVGHLIDSDGYPLADLASELEAVRQSTVFLFRHMDDAAWKRRGIANNAEVSVRALAYIIAGHELHHRAILSARYL